MLNLFWDKKRFTKALKAVHHRLFGGAGRAGRGDDLRQYPSSGGFSPGFEQEQGRQGKGKQLRHQLQYHLPTCSARCQPRAWHAARASLPAWLLSSCLPFKLPRPFLWAQSGISYSSSSVLILGLWSSCWNSFLKLFLGGLCHHNQCKVLFVPLQRRVWKKFSLMCVTNSFIRTYL